MDKDLADQVAEIAARVVASELRAAALQRAMTFDSQGTVRA